MARSSIASLVRRRLCLPAFIVATVMVAAACAGAATTAPSEVPSGTASPPESAGGGASTSPSTAASAAAAACGTYAGPDATIEYAIWGDTTELANQQKIVDAFMAANPKIRVNVTVADWTTYWDKLQTGIAGGNPPDVFLMDGPLFPDYQTRDQLLDLTPLIERDGFDTGQLADLAVQDFKAADGHLYGLPRDMSTVGLYFNKKMFDTAGIPYPDGTWDWNKLVSVAQKLTKTSGAKTTQWGFYTETTDMENYWSSLVWQNGGDILSADKTSVAIDTDQAAGGIQFLQDLIYKYKVMQQPTPGGAGDNFENGLAAMEANGSWLVPTHTAAGIDFGVAPLPKGPAGPATSVNPSGVVVYRGTKAPDAAWEFVKCYAGPAMQEKIADLKASMPANKQVLADTYAPSFDGGRTFADALAYAHLKPSFKGYNEFNTELQNALDANVFNEARMPAKQALEAVTPKLNQLLAGQ